MPAVYLQLQSVSKAFGEEEILAEVSLQVREGECVGLIGPNGAGKSTLFRIIMGLETSDRGEAVVPRGVRVGYLTQDAELAPDGTVLAGLIASRTDLAEIGARMHELETAMAAPNAHEEAGIFDRRVHEHSTLVERFHHLGGDTLEGDALRILRGLGLGSEYDNAVMGILSGGEKRRLALAALLLASPDLLLLDEPTNHLDLSAIDWLEEYLCAYRGGVLIVSHDRFLLDRVCDHIAEIEDTRLRQFDGNYSAYQQKKEAENAMMLKRADTIERERARLAESIQRLFSFRQFTRMRSQQKQLYKLEQIQLPGEAEKTRMAFKPARKSGREVLTVRDVRKRYTEAPLLEGASFTLWRHDRAALIGPNGCGKTTLLRIIVGQLGLDDGSTEFGHGVDWYYYDQEGGNLDPRNSVLREVWGSYPRLSPSEVRGALARFLIFGEDVERSVGTLSGGERSRVSLVKMFLSGANLLILDEPTNHLDIDGKEALEEALADYTGTVLMVSHDRYFIDRTANRVLEIEEGAIREYLGNYTEYLERKARRTEVPAPAPVVPEEPKPTAPAAPEPGRRRSLQYRRRQLQEIEARIHAMEAHKTALESLLADPVLYADSLRAMQVTEEHQHLLRDLRDVYEEWTTISEEVLALEAEAEALRQERLSKS